MSFLNTIKTSLASGMLVVMLGMIHVAPLQADDIDIYLQTPPANPAKPVVVLTLDLNLDLTDIACSNVLADPDTIVGEVGEATTCRLLQELAVLPVLEHTLGLNPGALLDLLLDESSPVDGLLGLVDGLTGITLAGLASDLEPIVGSDGITGTVVSLTQLDVVRLLLFRLLQQLVGVNLGIMVSHADTCEPGDFQTPRSDTTGCSNGAYFLLEPVELLESNVGDTLDTILARLNTIEVAVADLDDPEDQADLSPPFQAKEIYYELYRYFTGGTVYNAPLDDDDALAVSDPATPGASYNSPLGASTCQDIQVINVLFTDPAADADSDADILADSGLSGIDLDGNGDLEFGEMIQHFERDGFLFDNVNYKVKSKFLVNGVGEGGGITSLLGNAAGTLGTLPVGLNPIGVPFVTEENFQPVLAVSASFGGPQPVFTRNNLSESADALYYGMFKPDPDRKPAWRGNVKKLKLEEADGELTIIDARGQPAIAPDGNIRPQALTFWTVEDDLPPTIEGEVAGSDGKSTDLGGAGMFLIGPRTEPTETNPNSPGTGSDLGSAAGPRLFYQQAQEQAGDLRIAPFELTDTVTDEADPALDGDRADAGTLIAFARGYDAPDPNEEGYEGFLFFLQDTIGGLLAEIFDLLDDIGDFFSCIVFGSGCPDSEEPPPREWVMGDVLHSHPLPIDYGNDDIRIFAGSNLGFMHQFRDDALASETSSFEGQEVWRLAPRALLAHFDEWRSDSPTASSRPYGVDGESVAWVEDVDGTINASDGDHVYLYFGLRRGGKGYYALDVTNPDAQPVGKWHIEKTAGASSDFAELGLTFSTPRIGDMRIDDDGDPATLAPLRTVLIFGGGYDGGYDSSGNPLGKDAAAGSDDVLGGDDDEGNAIFIVDADSGELIWKARHGSTTGATTTDSNKPVWEHTAMDDSIPSALTVADTVGDGLFDRIYFGDTGGRVWRADIGSADPADWQAGPIFNLGRHATADVANDRRFFAQPDLIRVTNDANNGFFALVIGSGNRADPLNRNTDNFLYVLKDGGVLDTSATPITHDTLANFATNCEGASDCLSLLNTLQTPHGWKLPVGSNDRDGEKIFSSPTTVTGKVLFNSYVPPNLDVAACAPQEGSGRTYGVDLRDGTSVIPEFGEDGEPAGEGNLDYSRSTPLRSAGIPADTQYIRPQQFFSGDFGITNVKHKSTWRTYWRERIRAN